MLPLEVRKYLFDIQQASELLGQFTAGKSFHDYKTNALLRSAVERQFEILGEALNRALRVAPHLASDISDYQRIIAFRNRLIHGYAAIADDVVWGVLEQNLPRLRAEVGALLEDASSAPES